MNNKLIQFYCNDMASSSNHYLNDLFIWNNEAWDRHHDFIQWIFPLIEPSQFNPDAPLLDKETIIFLRNSEIFKENFLLILDRTYSFLGFHSRNSKPFWVTPNNHNQLRITRILTSCKLLSDIDIMPFFNWLNKLAENNPESISKVTLDFWKNAALTNYDLL